MKKVVIYGISGSNRKKSYNTAVLQFIKKRIDNDIEFKILNILDLPMYNSDLEENLPQSVIDFYEELKEANGFIISTPEYNYSIPPLLKNALDWASRSSLKLLENKYLAILSASPSLLGGARAQYQLRQICVSLDLNVINKPEVFISKVNDKIDENGEIIDEKTSEIIITLVNKMILKLKGEIYE